MILSENKMSDSKKRESNIELLRIVLMLGVVVLHYNNSSIGGAFEFTANMPVTRLVLYFFESLCDCAVDLFILISGYFMCKNNKRNLAKPVELLIQTILFAEGVYICKGLISGEGISVGSIVARLIPASYFVILYIAVYFVSPYINHLLNSLNQKQLSKMLVVLFVILSIYPTAVDMLIEIRKNDFMGLSTVGAYGSQWGYTLVNFILMYIIGAYLRLSNKLIPLKKAVLLLLAITIALVLWAMLDDKLGIVYERVAWEYCNPLIIMAAILLFMIFKQIHIPSNRIINSLATSSFSVYLLNTHLLKYFHIEFHVTSSIIVMILHMIATAIAIYLICAVVNFVYSMTVLRLVRGLESKISFMSNDIYGDLVE